MNRQNNRAVIVWLASGAILVATMVIVGGITRLTHSGLSMVDYKLLVGTIPPLSESGWQEAFDQYKQFPEYQKINTDFALNDFKSIFWWEYIHRVLGRVIGLVFIIPFFIFMVQRRFDREMILKLTILLAMGAFQGFMGWYMVKSGLINEPNVSHFRLAAHLFTAFIICAYTFWIILDLKEPTKPIITIPTLPVVLKYFLVLVLLQIIYGAFVAGLKAGLFYPTFPLMGNELIPSGISRAYNTSGLTSLINDITTVQFIHRWLGILSLVAVISLRFVYRSSILAADRAIFDGLFWLVLVQALLGVVTLLLGVPVIIAVTHQIVALLLLLGVVWNIHRFRYRY